MRIEFSRVRADPATKEIIQCIELRFTMTEWDAFAQTMQRAYDDAGQPVKEKVLRAIIECLQWAAAPKLQREVPLPPVDLVPGNVFRDLVGRAKKGTKT